MTKVEQKIQDTLETIGNILIEELRYLFVAEGKLLKKGGLVSSFDFNIKGKEIELTAADYFDFYMNGRKPGARKVPISALIKWIKRYRLKLNVQKRDARGRFRKIDININSLAFAIQTSIFKKGIKPKRKLFDDFLDGKEDIIAQLIDEAILEIVSESIEL